MEMFRTRAAGADKGSELELVVERKDAAIDRLKQNNVDSPGAHDVK